MASARAKTHHGSTIVLCAPAGTNAGVMATTIHVVAKRVHKGFGFTNAKVTIRDRHCIEIVLAHRIAWLRWLAQNVSEEGSFGLGVAQPSAEKQLLPGTSVRYPHDPVTAANSNRPIVRVVIGRPSIKRWTVRIERRGKTTYVALDLTSLGSKHFCRFTSHDVKGFAPVVLDRQIVSDPEVSTSICGGTLLIGFPPGKSLDRPLGPRQVVAEVRSGLLTFPLTIASVH